jgi:hypothetical protein
VGIEKLISQNSDEIETRQDALRMIFSILLGFIGRKFGTKIHRNEPLHQVSLMTARHALASLEREAIVVPRPTYRGI